MSNSILDIFNTSKRSVPFIPKPEPKEVPVREELVQDPRTAPRMHMIKHDAPFLKPKYNELYDTFRSKQAWNMSADEYVTGTTTTIAATEVSTAVNMADDPQWRLEQWPGGTLLFLCVRWFSICPTTATFATVGAIRATFTDRAGSVIPLGIFRSNESLNIIHSSIIPSPITNTGETRLGTVDLLLNTGATVGDYTWQLGLSACYLLPAMRGYSIEHMTREEREI